MKKVISELDRISFDLARVELCAKCANTVERKIVREYLKLDEQGRESFGLEHARNAELLAGRTLDEALHILEEARMRLAHVFVSLRNFYNEAPADERRYLDELLEDVLETSEQEGGEV